MSLNTLVLGLQWGDEAVKNNRSAASTKLPVSRSAIRVLRCRSSIMCNRPYFVGLTYIDDSHSHRSGHVSKHYFNARWSAAQMTSKRLGCNFADLKGNSASKLPIIRFFDRSLQFRLDSCLSDDTISI